jgi:hypothetical protein
VQNGRGLAQQLQDLHQQQLEQLLHRKQQLSGQRAKTRADRPDRSP